MRLAVAILIGQGTAVLAFLLSESKVVLKKTYMRLVVLLIMALAGLSIYLGGSSSINFDLYGLAGLSLYYSFLGGLLISTFMSITHISIVRQLLAIAAWLLIIIAQVLIFRSFLTLLVFPGLIVLYFAMPSIDTFLMFGKNARLISAILYALVVAFGVVVLISEGPALFTGLRLYLLLWVAFMALGIAGLVASALNVKTPLVVTASLLLLVNLIGLMGTSVVWPFLPITSLFLISGFSLGALDSRLDESLG